MQPATSGVRVNTTSPAAWRKPTVSAADSPNAVAKDRISIGSPAALSARSACTARGIGPSTT